MSFSKLPFLIANGLGVQVSLTSPNPTPSSSERSRVHDRWSLWLSWSPFALKALYWTLVLAETTAIAAHANPTLPYVDKVLPYLVRSSPEGLRRIHASTTFLVGSAMIASSSLLRYACYRTLGRFFTFELALRDKHKLVTWGPYGWVRHPSYTGSVLMLAGYGLTTLTSGSWLREAGWLSGTIGQGAAVALTAYLAWVSWILISRTSAEDALLKKEFGAEWEEWARRVKWRVLPGIY